MITFEYILIAGVNDGARTDPAAGALAHRLHAKVNLIPYNKVEDLPWERPDRGRAGSLSRRAGKAKGHRHVAPGKGP